MVNKKEPKDVKKRITFTLDPHIIEQLKKLSEETMIPQSRLVEKALNDMIHKK